MLKEILDKLDKQSLYEMANFHSKHTGLPVTIWVSVKYENHKPRIKIMDEECNISISIEDNPKVLAGNCKSNKILKKVFEWIKLNKKVLLDYWNEKIDTFDLVKQLKPLRS